MTDREKQQLDDTGFVVLPDFMGLQLLADLRRRVAEVFAEEGNRAGSEFKQEQGCRRLANCVDKGEVFRQAIALPQLLPYIQHVLGPKIKLSSLNVRSVDPHSAESQPLHADMAAVPDERGYWVCNTVWMLDDFTLENGPIRVVPGSHRWGKLPQETLVDSKAAHPHEVFVTGEAGSVAVMNAHTWHGGMANRTRKHAPPCTAFIAVMTNRSNSTRRSY